MVPRAGTSIPPLLALVFSLLLSLATDSKGAVISYMPGPDDIGGMIMIEYKFSSTGVVALGLDDTSGHSVEPGRLTIGSLQSYQYYETATFASSLPWFDYLDPNRDNLAFSTRYGFNTTTAYAVPDNVTVLIKAISISSGLSGYFYSDGGAGQGFGGGDQSTIQFLCAFGEDLTDPGQSYSTVSWSSDSLAMWHPVFIANAPGDYSATFEVYYGDQNTGEALPGYSSAQWTLEWHAVPEPGTNALILGGLVLLVLHFFRQRQKRSVTAGAPNTRPSSPLRGGSGFTLVETLVTMCIVGLLVAFAGAAYGTAKSQSLSAACSNKMRSLAQGILLYTQDNDGTFPKSSHSGTSWARNIAPYVGQPVSDDISSYATSKVFLCPENRPVAGQQQSWSYGLNVFFELQPGGETYRNSAGILVIKGGDSYQGSPATWHKTVNITRPGRTILLAENANSGSASDHFMAHQWHIIGAASNAIASKRHGKTSNYAFVDGHVEALKVTDTFDPENNVNLWNPSLAQ